MKMRPAIKNDAKLIAKLSIEAIGTIANVIANSSDPEKILNSLVYWSQKSGNRISYENTLVATENNEEIGIMILYPADECQALDEPINKWLSEKSSEKKLDIEAEGNYLYIDTIVVSQKYRGQGYAVKMLDEAYKISIEKKYSGTSLNVEANNKKALNVYLKNGYTVVKERYLANKLHYYMTKVK